MSEITVGNTTKFEDDLIASAFKHQPFFVPNELEPFYKFMDIKFPGMALQHEVCMGLLQSNIIDATGTFTEYAVNKGLAIEGCSKCHYLDMLEIEKDWYVTAQGKSVITEIFQANFRWQ